MVRNGDQVIEALGLKGKTFNGALEHLGVLSAGFLVCSWFGLLFQQRHKNFRTRSSNGNRSVDSVLVERERQQKQSWSQSDSAGRRIATTNRIRL